MSDDRDRILDDVMWILGTAARQGALLSRRWPLSDAAAISMARHEAVGSLREEHALMKARIAELEEELSQLRRATGRDHNALED